MSGENKKVERGAGEGYFQSADIRYRSQPSGAAQTAPKKKPLTLKEELAEAQKASNKTYDKPITNDQLLSMVTGISSKLSILSKTAQQEWKDSMDGNVRAASLDLRRSQDRMKAATNSLLANLTGFGRKISQRSRELANVNVAPVPVKHNVSKLYELSIVAVMRQKEEERKQLEEAKNKKESQAVQEAKKPQQKEEEAIEKGEYDKPTQEATMMMKTEEVGNLMKEAVGKVVEEEAAAEGVEKEAVAEGVEKEAVAEVIEKQAAAEGVEKEAVAEVIEKQAAAEGVEKEAVAEVIEKVMEEAAVKVEEEGEAKVEEGVVAK